jgi:hypothetical protein
MFTRSRDESRSASSCWCGGSDWRGPGTTARGATLQSPALYEMCWQHAERRGITQRRFEDLIVTVDWSDNSPSGSKARFLRAIGRMARSRTYTPVLTVVPIRTRALKALRKSETDRPGPVGVCGQVVRSGQPGQHRLSLAPESEQHRGCRRQHRRSDLTKVWGARRRSGAAVSPSAS